MMSADGLEIRRLAQEDPTDAVLFRGIRLEALQANPEAFASTFEVENAQPLSWFSARLGDYVDPMGIGKRRVPIPYTCTPTISSHLIPPGM